MQLSWLPPREDWDGALRSVKSLPAVEGGVLLAELAKSRMEFAQVVRLDKTWRKVREAGGGELAGFERVRVAMLGSATTGHLAAGIRVAGLRRGLDLEIYEAPYGTYRQELADAGSRLHGFQPEVVLFCLQRKQ